MILRSDLVAPHGACVSPAHTALCAASEPSLLPRADCLCAHWLLTICPDVSSHLWLDFPLPSFQAPTIIAQAAVNLFALCLPIPWRGTWLHFPTAFRYAWLHIWLFLYRPYTSIIGPLNLIIIDRLDWLGLCCGDCPVHNRILSSIPGLYPPGASDTPTPTQIVATRNVCRHWEISLGVGRGCQNHPLLTASAL